MSHKKKKKKKKCEGKTKKANFFIQKSSKQNSAAMQKLLSTLGIVEPSVMALFPVRLAMLPVTLFKGGGDGAGAKTAGGGAGAADTGSGDAKDAAAAEAARAAAAEQQRKLDEARRLELEKRRLAARLAEEESIAAQEAAYEKAVAALRVRVRERWNAGGDEASAPPYDYSKIITVVTERIFPMMEGEDAESMEEQLAESIAARSHPTLLDRLDRAIDTYRDEVKGASE
jgi:hypothetical protein